MNDCKKYLSFTDLRMNWKLHEINDCDDENQNDNETQNDVIIDCYSYNILIKQYLPVFLVLV